LYRGRDVAAFTREEDPVPRPPEPPDRADIPLSEAEDYDAIVGRFASRIVDGAIDPGPYFSVLLNSPPLAAPIVALSRRVRHRGEHEGSFSHADREFVDHVLMTDWNANQFRSIHVADALEAGVRIDAIEAIMDRREVDLTEDEQLLAAFIRQVVSGAVEDETYDRIEARLGKRGAIEYTIFILYLQLTIRLAQAFGLPEPTEEEVRELVREFREGKREMPSHDSTLQLPSIDYMKRVPAAGDES
jgi:hypothetical protein